MKSKGDHLNRSLAEYILAFLVVACFAAVPAMAAGTSQPTHLDTGQMSTPRGQAITLMVYTTAATKGGDLIAMGTDFGRDPNLSSSTKTSNKGGEQVTPGSLVEYTVKLVNTGVLMGSVTVTDVLGNFYAFQQSEDFTESPAGTLTWNGEVGTEPVLLKFVVQVVGLDDLPVGETILDNTARIGVGDNTPLEISDQTPPKVVVKQSIFVPAVMRTYFTCATNHTLTAACGPLPRDVPYVGYCQGGEDKRSDYFYINVVQNQRVELTLTVPEPLDLDLWVYDANRELVAGSSTAGKGERESIKFKPESGGKHYIRVYRFAGDDLTKPYTLEAKY